MTKAVSSKKVIPIKKTDQSKTAKTSAKSKKMASEDPIKKKKQVTKAQNKAFIKSSMDLAKKIKSSAVFIYIDAVDESLINEKFSTDQKVILVTKKPDYSYSGSLAIQDTIYLPKLKLGRMGIVKIAVLLALSAKQVKLEDTVLFLLGKAETQLLDTVMCLNIEEESELLTGHSVAQIPSTMEFTVFEQALNIAIELGNKGKEGKQVGTIFVLGDEDRVMQLSKQMIINPFKGYEPDERNLLNPALKETIREFSTLDGAFVIAGNGEVITAGRYLGAATEDSDIPRGLGSRHIAAAGITALTNALAIVISESTGDVRIFKNGQVIMTLDKPSHE